MGAFCTAGKVVRARVRRPWGTIVIRPAVKKLPQECGEAWGVGVEAAWATYFIRVALVTKHGDISVGIRQDENGSRIAVVHGGRRDVVVVRPRTRTVWTSFHHNKILSSVNLTPPNQTQLLLPVYKGHHSGHASPSASANVYQSRLFCFWHEYRYDRMAPLARHWRFGERWPKQSRPQYIVLQLGSFTW